MTKAYQERILEYIRATKGPVTTDQVAKALDISWQTAQLHLLNLANQERINFQKIGRQNLFMKRGIRAEKNEYRALFDESPEPSIIFDRETLELLAVNNTFVNLSGFSREELVGMKVTYLLANEQDRELLELRVHRKKGFDDLPDGKTYRTLGIWNISRKDGKPFLCEMMARPLQFEGRLANFIIAQPVQQTKVPEIHPQEARFPLVAVLPAIVWTARPDGSIDFANQLWYEYTGLTFAQTRTNPWPLLIHPQDQHRWQDMVKQSKATAEPFEEEFKLLRADGEYRTHLARVTPIKDEKGRITMWAGCFLDYEHKRNIGEKLQESEDRFKLIVEGIRDYAIFMIDIKGRVTSWNLGAERIKGWTAKEIIGKPYSTFFLKEDIDNKKPEHILKEAAVHGQYHEEGWRVRKDGSTFRADIVVTAIKDENGNLKGFAKVTRDITEKQRFERQISVGESKYDSLFEQLAVGVVEVAPDGNILSANNRFCEITGYSEKELTGKRISDITPPEFQNNDREGMRAMAEGKRLHYLTEKQYVRKNGERTWVRITASPVWDNNVVTFVAVVEDIDESKRMAQQLNDVARVHSLILDTAAEGIFGIDINGNLTFINPAAAEMIGWSAKDIIGKQTHALLHHTRVDGSPYPREECFIYQSLRDGESYRVDDEVFWRKDGSNFPVEYTCTPIMQDEKIIGATLVFRDISDIRKHQEEQNELLARMTLQRKRLRDVIENVPGVVWEAWGNPDAESQHINFVSDHVETMLGYSVLEWLSTPNFWLTIVHPDDRDRAAAEAAAIFASGKPGVSEFRWMKKDGQAIWVEAQSVVVLDENGNPAGMRGVTMDITKRKLAEIELAKSKERLELAHAVGRIATFESDAKTGRTISWSGIEDIFPLSSEEIAEGLSALQKLVHPDDAEITRQKVQHSLTTGTPLEHEYRIIMPDDQSIHWIYVRANMIPGPDGTPAEFVGVNIDITARKMQEIELKETRERMRLVTSNVPALVSYIDKDTRYVFANDQYTVWFGLGVDDIVGKTMAEVIGETGFAKVKPHIDKVLGGEEVIYESEIPYAHGGTRHIRGHYTPHIVNGETVGFFVLVLDISERIESEQELKRATAKVVEQRAQLEAVFQSMQDGVMVFDMQGKSILANEALARINEYPNVDAMMKDIDYFASVYQLSLPDGTLLPVEQWPVSRIMRGECLTEWVLHGKRIDTGKEWIFSFSGEPVYDEQGNQVLAVTITRDITESKRAELAVRNSRDQLNAILEGVPSGIAAISPKGEYLYANEIVAKMTGFSSIEEMKQAQYQQVRNKITFYDEKGNLLSKEQLPTYRALHGEVVENMFLRYRFGDEERVVLASSTPILDGAGNVQFALVVSTDITDVIQARQEVAETSERLKVAQSASRSFTFEWDMRTNQIKTTGDTSLVYGVSAEVLGENYDDWSKFTHPEDMILAQKEIEAAIREKRPYRLEYRTLQPDGSYKWAHVRAEILTDEQGVPVRSVGLTMDVTQKRHADEEIKRSRDQLNIILQGVTDGVIAQSNDGTIMYANDAAAQITGLGTVNELIGVNAAALMKYFQIFTPEGDPYPMMELPTAKARQGQYPPAALMKFAYKDNPERWIIMDSQPVKNDNGEVAFIIIIFRDITESRYAEEQLQRSRDQLNIILQGVRDGITALTPDGRLIYANHTAAQTCGFDSVEEFTAAGPREVMKRFDVLDEEGNLIPLESLASRRALQGEVVYDQVTQFRIKATGEIRWSLVSSRPVLDAEGKVRFALNIFRDITDERLAEQRREKEEYRTRFLNDTLTELSQSPDYEPRLKALAEQMVPTLADWCAVDMLGGIEEPKRVAVVHPNPENIRLAHRLRELQPYDPHAPTGLAKVLRTGKTEYMAELPWKMIEDAVPEGELRDILRVLKLYSFIIVPLIARGKVLGAITVVMAESGRKYNIDDVKFVEEIAHRAAIAIDNARLYQDAQQALALRDDFLSIASHELKTPVTSIKAFLQALERRMTQPQNFDFDKNLQYMRLSVKQVDRLGAIINDLLDINRIAKGKMEYHFKTIPIGPIVADAVERMGISFPTHRLNLKLQDLTTKVRVDELRFEQVLTNLITNAAKYSPENSSIDIITRTDGINVYIDVKDQGIGISKEDQEVIFDRYYRTPQAVSTRAGGLGVGLFISYELIKAHGGQILVSSKVGEGSTFTIVLPCTGD